MPELPEVETMCRGIRPIVGRKIEAVERPVCKRRPISIEPRIDAFHRSCSGKYVAGIERLGKRVVIWLSQTPPSKKPNGKSSQQADDQRGEAAIVIEPRMTGLALLADPPTTEHLRLRIKFAANKTSRFDANIKLAEKSNKPFDPKGLAKKISADEFLFWDRRGLGTVRLLNAEQMEERFLTAGPTRALGPDALKVSEVELREQFRQRRRAIKVALLDQQLLAGVGNLYASEILHVARVHPAQRCDRLRFADWQRIHSAMLEVLKAAIRYEGSTLADGTYRNALNESGGYQNHHRVYDLAGQNCRSCNSAVVRRIVQAQRSTFFCPECQKR